MAVEAVLIIDDEPSVLAAARRSLRTQCTVATADSVDRGLELAREYSFDVAIIDLRIAGDSGLEMLRTLKSERPGTFAVLYSGFLSVPTAVAATRAGADLVLSKPISFRDILARIGTDQPVPEETPTLARVEWDHIARVLEDCDGNISEAARRLGIYRSSLQRKLRKYAPKR